MTDIDRNLHVHTWLSTCGRVEQSLANVIPECAALGFRYVLINDHHHEPARDYYAMANYNRRRIVALQPRFPDMRVLLGCEAQMNSPECCSIDEALAAEYEVVLCAGNHYGVKGVESPSERTPRGYGEHHLRMLAGAIHTGFVDVLVHPFVYGEVGGVPGHAVRVAFRDGEIADLVDLAASRGVAFELNPRHAEPAAEWFRELIQAIRAAGGRVSLGSDAHNLRSLGYPWRDDPTRSYTWADLSRLFGLRPSDLYTPVCEGCEQPVDVETVGGAREGRR